MGGALAGQGELYAAQQDIQESVDALAARIGTRFYTTYLNQRASLLTGIVTEAANLLENFTHVQFPSAMCPLNDANGANFVQTPLCTSEPPAVSTATP